MRNTRPIVAPNANSLRSASASMEDHGQIKAKKGVGWELQRRVPNDVAMSIEIERRKRAARGLST